MKRIISILSVLLMIAFGAQAAEWAEGCSPENPYADAQGVPVDFSKTTGYMLFRPATGSSCDYGVHSFTIYMPREDLEIGKGTLYVLKADGTSVAKVELTEANFFQRAMTERELGEVLWGCGTAFTVELGIVLQGDTEYVLQVTEGAIKAPDYGNATPAIAGRDTWAFTVGTEGENAIDRMYIYRGEEPAAETLKEEDAEATDETESEAAEAEATEQTVLTLSVPEDALAPGAELQIGDTVHFILRIGGKATSASIYLDEGSLEASDTYFEKESEVVLRLSEPGNVRWGVVWLNENGKVVESESFDYVVK